MMKHTIAYGTSNLKGSYSVNFNGRRIYMKMKVRGFKTDMDAKKFMKSLYGKKYISIYIQSDTEKREMISSIVMEADDGIKTYPENISSGDIFCKKMLDEILESNRQLLEDFLKKKFITQS